MISLKDIPDAISELNSGGLTLPEFLSLCWELFEYHEVETVLASLPEGLRESLITDLITTCDNNVPAEDFFLFSSARGDHPAKLVIIERIRGWITRHRLQHTNTATRT